MLTLTTIGKYAKFLRKRKLNILISNALFEVVEELIK